MKPWEFLMEGEGIPLGIMEDYKYNLFDYLRKEII